MTEWAVITGASSGLGTEFAKKLAKRGYKLLLVARREDRLLKIKEQVETECEIFTADLSKEEDVRRLFDKVKDLDLDVFINNAGYGDCAPFLEADREKLLKMVDLNVRAVHILTTLVLDKMNKAGKGYLLNVASSAGLLPAGPYMSTYYATKAYVASLTRGIARELKEAKSPVYIGALCPGPVDTEFNRVANAEFSLKGITADFCTEYALKMMFKRKTVIVPSFIMKAGTFFARILPPAAAIGFSSSQQKKKIGA